MEKHVVEDGRVITSAGISAGIDMALRVVARYSGEDIARATARHMDIRIRMAMLVESAYEPGSRLKLAARPGPYHSIPRR